MAESRLDVFCGENTALSRSQAQRLIREGSITVDGKAAKANRVLKPGECIEIVYPAPVPSKAQAQEMPLSILYEDADLLVVDKPQGMVVHPAAGHADGTLVNALLYHIQDLSGIGGEMRPGIVHRIDRMTSGLLVVAKNDRTHLALSDQFKKHTAFRWYAAICEGNFKEDAGTVDMPIGRHKTDRKKMAVTPDGRDAVTHWQVVERLSGYTLLLAKLETGRTHQIRVHMAYLNHPLAGDMVYGCKKAALGLSGQALHGYRLAFTHPASGKEMVFYAPIPPYFMDALKRLGDQRRPEAVLAQLKGLESLQKEK